MNLDSSVTKKPSYFRAFLAHPRNVLFLAVAGCAAMLVSIPFGWNAIAAIGVATLGIEAIAALLVPDLPGFRAAVDAEYNVTTRLARQNRLVSELSQLGETKALETFEHMRSRINALYQTAGDANTTITAEDVGKLADITVDYLNLSMVNRSLRDRRSVASDEEIKKKIAALQGKLGAPGVLPEERLQIQKALSEYTEAASRSRRLETRRNALEATLIAMPDKLEEVYQLVMAAPFSAEMGGKIEESLARLRVAEEVAAEFEAGDFRNESLSFSTTAETVPPINAARNASRALKN